MNNSLTKLKSLVGKLFTNKPRGEMILYLFKLMRYEYYKRNEYSIKKLLETANIDILDKNIPVEDEKLLYEIINRERIDWGDVNFHLRYRIQDIDDLIELKPELQDSKNSMLKAVNEKGYLLSILPLNLLLPREVLNQFLPPHDFSTPHPAKDIDPYGIASYNTKIVKDNLWLGSKKFPHTVLMNIHGHCPIGCSDCYKSYYVREKGRENELGAGDPYEKVPVKLKEQTISLVEWLNKNPQVYDVIISGGEPLLRPNIHIKLMLEEFKKAKFLKILRICTGVIFLGLPFRIDDELLDILLKFSEDTGVKITFQAHLSNHLQITPEAVIAVKKIREAGFNIYSQTPIKEGINFFSNDIEKTLIFLRELVRKQFLIGVEPYKLIVDMHPRTIAYYVPIEKLSKVFSALFDSHVIPDLERPKTLSILSKQGNLVLSWHSLFAMKKEVDTKKGIVRYHIPKVILEKNEEVIEDYVYEEPLLVSNEDPDSLLKIQNNWLAESK